MQTISVCIDQVEVEDVCAENCYMTSEIHQSTIEQFSLNIEVKILTSNYNQWCHLADQIYRG